MTRAHKIEAWIACAVALCLIASTVALIRWQRQNPILLRGAVLAENSDPQKQLPIAGVLISAADLAATDAKTDSSGFFVLKLRKPIRKGHPIGLSFRAPQYRPLDLKESVSNRLYVVHLVPLSTEAPTSGQPRVKVANVRVRYTVKAKTEVNIGSAVKTFEILNKGNVACKSQSPCSPDGKWKAASGSATLDAGAGNELRDARVSCIAGPCPFTKIAQDVVSQNGQDVTVSALDWSDTATFLVEAEVFRPMVSQTEHWSYPIIFADGLSFTLPTAAESVSIEADVDGQMIIFPLGPSLFLSWGSCDAVSNQERGRVYRCTPKPGYRFQ